MTAKIIPIKPISNLHKAALEMAEGGFPIFPCLPNKKTPACAHGHLDATLDPLVIDAWWTANPDYNIGFSPDPAGLAIIDLDVKGGKQGPANWAKFVAENKIELPPTCEVTTWSGGKHLYFKGSLPSTVDKLGLGIDTRGRGGYVIVPPSVVEGKPYIWATEDGVVDLPPQIGERLATVEAVKTSGSAELDTLHNVGRARTLLLDKVREGEVAISGLGGNNKTYQLACTVRDFGISQETSSVLLSEHWNPHCQPPWSQDELDRIIGNAYNHAQNPEIGAKADPTGAEVFGDKIEQEPEVKAVANDFTGGFSPKELLKAGNRFPSWSADHGLHMPIIRYWDKEHTMPRDVEGGVVIVNSGKKGTYKTAMAICDALDAIEQGARVLYLAGEGAHGIAINLLPAAVAARSGMTLESLTASGAWVLVPAVPKLDQELHIAALIAKFHADKFDLAYVDTASTARGKFNENDSDFGDLTMDDGQLGRISRGLRCPVNVIHHIGKDASKGSRGHSSFADNSYGECFTTFNKTSGMVYRHIERLKDAESDFDIAYKVMTPKGDVPVLKRIGRVTEKAMKQKNLDRRAMVIGTLFELGAIGPLESVSTQDIAELIIDQAHDTEEKQTLACVKVKKTLAAWPTVRKTTVKGQMKQLQRWAAVEGEEGLLDLAHKAPKSTQLDWYLPTGYRAGDDQGSDDASEGEI